MMDLAPRSTRCLLLPLVAFATGCASAGPGNAVPPSADLQLDAGIGDAAHEPADAAPDAVAAWSAPRPFDAGTFVSSWIGNTFGTATGVDKGKGTHRDWGVDWVPGFIQAIAVGDDGSVVTNGAWDELNNNVSVFKDGKFVASTNTGNVWCGFRMGSTAVAINTKYIFSVHQIVDAQKAKHYVLARRQRAAVNRTAPLGAGKVPDWDGCHDVSQDYFVDLGVLATGTAPKDAATISAAANDSMVVVTDLLQNRVSIYDPERLTVRHSFPLQRAGQVAIDKAKNLWITVAAAEAGKPAKVVHVRAEGGAKLPGTITDVEDPQGIAIDPSTGHLLVVDHGKAQQVVVFDVAHGPRPKRVGALGLAGGIAAGRPGEVTGDKLLNPTSVGADAEGNVYVAGYLPSYIRKLDPRGALAWEVDGLIPSGNAVANPATDGADVYTGTEHFRIDYDAAPGKEWSWKGHTLDSHIEPEDVRLNGGYHPIAVRRIGDHDFLFSTSQGYYGNLAVHRIDGETAVPVGFIAAVSTGWVPENKATQFHNGNPTAPLGWMWADLDGDGRFQRSEITQSGTYDQDDFGWDVDAKGNLWIAKNPKIAEMPLGALTPAGSPTYSYATMKSTPMPPEFGVITRVQYVDETDTMYVGGWDASKTLTTRPAVDWHCIGNLVARYDHWKAGPHLAWTLPLRLKGALNVISSWQVAGDRLFAGVEGTEEGGSIEVYDALTGRAVGTVKPGLEAGGHSGWLDMPYAVRAFRRANGEYVVLVEDDAYNRVMMYRGRW
jgi:DNA-binding beta-propeller fold protein YncE